MALLGVFIFGQREEKPRHAIPVVLAISSSFVPLARLIYRLSGDGADDSR